MPRATPFAHAGQPTQDDSRTRGAQQRDLQRLGSAHRALGSTHRKRSGGSVMIRLFERVISSWVAVMLFALLLVMLADVILRNLFDAPLSTGTEISELLMGAMGFGAFPLLALKAAHISVDLLQIRHNGVVHRTIGVVASLAIAGLFFILADRMYLMIARTKRSGEILPELGISLSWIWWLLLALSVLTALVSVVAAYR